MGNYFKMRDERNYEKIDDILSEMPEFVGQFIIGISSRTSVLTRLNYLLDIRVFFTYLSKNKLNNSQLSAITMSDIEHLSPYDIEKYLVYLTHYSSLDGKKHSCGEKAKERKLSSIRALYKYLYKKEAIKSNVTLKIDMPKIHDKPIVRLDSVEVESLLEEAENASYLSAKEKDFHSATKERDLAIISLFLGTGIRVSELVGLNRQDLNLEDRSFTVTRKGGDESILYLPVESTDALKNYLAWLNDHFLKGTDFARKIIDHDPLFYSLQGKRICVRSVEKLVKKYAASAAPLKKITPHKLRSTFATNLYNETENIYVVADVLGHSDVNTTKRHYAAMNEDIKRKAAEVTRLKKSKDD